MDSDRCSCSIMNPTDSSAPPKAFTFDGVYSINSTTEQIYNESAYPLIEVRQIVLLFEKNIFLCNALKYNINL